MRPDDPLSCSYPMRRSYRSKWCDRWRRWRGPGGPTDQDFCWKRTRISMERRDGSRPRPEKFAPQVWRITMAQLFERAW